MGVFIQTSHLFCIFVFVIHPKLLVIIERGFMKWSGEITISYGHVCGVCARKTIAFNRIKVDRYLKILLFIMFMTFLFRSITPSTFCLVNFEVCGKYNSIYIYFSLLIDDSFLLFILTGFEHFHFVPFVSFIYRSH